MREFVSPNRHQPLESFERAINGPLKSNADHELLHFRDATAILYRVRGQEIDWKTMKHARPESQQNGTVLSLSDGTRFAIGAGIVSALPELDVKTGDFAKLAARPAIEIRQIAPDGLPNVTIGGSLPWLKADVTVESAMVLYKTVPLDATPDIDMQCHVISALELLRDSAVDFATELGELAIRPHRIR